MGSEMVACAYMPPLVHEKFITGESSKQNLDYKNVQIRNLTLHLRNKNV
jgi:hypothetical protein